MCHVMLQTFISGDCGYVSIFVTNIFVQSGMYLHQIHLQVAVWLKCSFCCQKKVTRVSEMYISLFPASLLFVNVVSFSEKGKKTYLLHLFIWWVATFWYCSCVFEQVRESSPWVLIYKRKEALSWCNNYIYIVFDQIYPPWCLNQAFSFYFIFCLVKKVPQTTEKTECLCKTKDHSDT